MRGEDIHPDFPTPRTRPRPSTPRALLRLPNNVERHPGPRRRNKLCHRCSLHGPLLFPHKKRPEPECEREPATCRCEWPCSNSPGAEPCQSGGSLSIRYTSLLFSLLVFVLVADVFSHRIPWTGKRPCHTPCAGLELRQANSQSHVGVYTRSSNAPPPPAYQCAESGRRTHHPGIASSQEWRPQE